MARKNYIQATVTEPSPRRGRECDREWHDYSVPADPKERRGVLPKTLVAQSEDVFVDTRGCIYVTDKTQGLHILRCTV